MREKPHILFIAHRIPFPPNKGDKIRSYHMVRHLTRRYAVTVACMVDDAADLEYLQPLQEMTYQVFHEFRSPLKMKMRAALTLGSGKPMTLPCFYSTGLQQKIDAYLEDTQVRAVICFCSSSAEYVFRSRHCRDLAKKVLLADLV
ncbi:MAG: hypothetical protein P8X63_11705, partial [Desulfuromonadaceae bacterium]